MADIYLGSTDLSGKTFKMGSDDVSALYMGSTELWSSAPAGPVNTGGMFVFLDPANTNSYGGSGDRWSDISGNSNDANFDTGEANFVSDGDSSYFDYDGSNGSGARVGPMTVGGLSEYTVNFWVYKDNYGAGSRYQSFFRFPENGNTILFAFQEYDAILAHGLETSTGYNEDDISISSGDYSNQWVYVTISWDGSTKRTYRNGVLLSTDSRSGTMSSYSNDYYGIGCRTETSHPFGSEVLEGRVGVVHLHDEYLDTSEILANFNAMKSRYGL